MGSKVGNDESLELIVNKETKSAKDQEREHAPGGNSLVLPENLADNYRNFAVDLGATVASLDKTARDLEKTRLKSRLHMLGWAAVLLFTPVVFLSICVYMPNEWKLRAINVVMGTGNSWEAGNRILSVANPDRYRSLQMMVSIQENNEIKIKRCIARASAYDLPVKCDLTVKPFGF